MDQKQKNALVDKAVEQIKQLDLEHPEGSIFITAINSAEHGPAAQKMVVSLQGCGHGLEHCLIAAAEETPEFAKIIRSVAKKIKAAGKGKKFSSENFPGFPGSTGHPLEELFTALRKAQSQRRQS